MVANVRSTQESEAIKFMKWLCGFSQHAGESVVVELMIGLDGTIRFLRCGNKRLYVEEPDDDEAEGNEIQIVDLDASLQSREEPMPVIDRQPPEVIDYIG